MTSRLLRALAPLPPRSRVPAAFALALLFTVACAKKAHSPPLDDTVPGPGTVLGGGLPDAGTDAEVSDAGGWTMTTLVQGVPQPLSIALGDTAVYFTTAGAAQDDGGIRPFSGAIYRVDKTGGEAQAVATQQDRPYEVVFTSAGIAWTNVGSGQLNGSVVFLPTGATPRTLAAGETAVSIAADRDFFYWSSVLDLFGGGAVIERSAIVSGGPDTLATLQDPLQPAALAIDANYIYLAASGPSAGVFRVPIAGGGNIETLLELAGSPLTDILVAGDTVYIAEGDDVNGRILSIPTTGGRTTVLATSQAHPMALAVDARSLYWTAYVQDGAVMAIPLGSGGTATPVPIVSHVAYPRAIAAGAAVYFTTLDAVLKTSR